MEDLLFYSKCINLIFRVACKILVKIAVFSPKARMEAWLYFGELNNVEALPANRSQGTTRKRVCASHGVRIWSRLKVLLHVRS